MWRDIVPKFKVTDSPRNTQSQEGDAVKLGEKIINGNHNTDGHENSNLLTHREIPKARGAMPYNPARQSKLLIITELPQIQS